MNTPDSYADAQTELRAILESLQQPGSPLDEMTTKVKRAKELIDWCRTRLRITEEEVNALLADPE